MQVIEDGQIRAVVIKKCIIIVIIIIIEDDDYTGNWQSFILWMFVVTIYYPAADDRKNWQKGILLL